MVDPAGLFTPFQLRSATLRNRIVMAPMTRNFAPTGVPGPQIAAYYRRRAEHGVGLIITEGTWVPHPGAAGYPDIPRFYGEDALAGWTAVAREVHAVGGCIMPQLWHVGLCQQAPRGKEGAEPPPVPPGRVGPSGIAGGLGVPIRKAAEPMTLADIEAVIDAFATAAKSACDLGFDGVELHGAHGYIIDQFLWHRTNLRTDAYGGSFENRARFAADIIREIRRRTRPDFPIVLRYSQWKLHDYGARLADTPQELERLLKPIVDAGVDLFDCSQRRFWEPAFEGSDLNLAGWTKKLTGKPTMTVGSISLDREFMSSMFGTERRANIAGIDRLVEMFDRGDFDLVGVGRALISDPEWVEKVRSRRISELRPYTPELLRELV